MYIEQIHFRDRMFRYMGIAVHPHKNGQSPEITEMVIRSRQNAADMHWILQMEQSRMEQMSSSIPLMIRLLRSGSLSHINLLKICQMEDISS